MAEPGGKIKCLWEQNTNTVSSFAYCGWHKWLWGTCPKLYRMSGGCSSGSEFLNSLCTLAWPPEPTQLWAGVVCLLLTQLYGLVSEHIESKFPLTVSFVLSYAQSQDKTSMTKWLSWSLIISPDFTVSLRCCQRKDCLCIQVDPSHGEFYYYRSEVCKKVICKCSFSFHVVWSEGGFFSLSLWIWSILEG